MTMMDRLLSVKDIQERYQCNPATARKYIREMDHMEKPLMVREKEVMAWEQSKMVPSSRQIMMAMRQRRAKRC